MSVGTVYWGVVIPGVRRNLALNPSFEIDLYNWDVSVTNMSTGRTANQQFSGALCLELATTVTSAASGTVYTLGSWPSSGEAGTHVTSVYLNNYVWMGLGGTATAILMSLDGTAVGTLTPGQGWRRLWVASANTGLAVRNARLVIQNWGGPCNVAIDAWQYEVGSVPSTYFDGDSRHGTWMGLPHVDPSIQTVMGRGGWHRSLAELGFLVEAHAGIGHAPLSVTTSTPVGPSGVVAGQAAVRPRTFSLSGVLLGTSTAHLHQIRQRLIQALTPVVQGEVQPVRLTYAGPGVRGTWYLDAYYQGGLEVTSAHVSAEQVTVTFLAPDPFWRSFSSAGTVIGGPSPLQADGCLARTPEGAWLATSSLAPPVVYHVNAERPGTAILCGEFGSVSGTALQRIGAWSNIIRPLRHSNGTPGFPVGTPWRSSWFRDDQGQLRLLIGGNMSGTGYAQIMAYRFATTLAGNGTYTAIAIGSAATAPSNPMIVYDFVYLSGGTLLAAADTPTGIRCEHLLGFAMSYPMTGSINGWGRSIELITPNRVLLAGSFTDVNGTACRHLALMDLAANRWGTYRWDPGTPIASLAVTPKQDLYTYVPSGTASLRGYWRIRPGGADLVPGQFWGVAGQAPPFQQAHAITTTLGGELLAVGGTISVTGTRAPNIPARLWAIGRWTGYGWTYTGVYPDGDGTIYGVSSSPDGTWYLYGSFSTTVQPSARVTLVNAASAPCLPIFRLVGTTASQYVLLHGITNLTTQRGVYGVLFTWTNDMILINGETNTCTSMLRGDLREDLDPACAPAHLALVPGTNVLDVIVRQAGQMTVYWTPTAYSPDGTI